MRVNHCSPQVQLSAVCASILSLAYFANPTLAAMQKMSERALSCHSLRHVHVFYVEGPVWMAPALQAFSGDICGLFSQNSRVSGLFMFRHCLHWP
jgi:hypothetical protein